jgi:uncharacterized protein YdcH (DUF465 family)
MSDRHFARLYDEFDIVSHAIEHIESGKEAASDERLGALKKKRLNLKDSLLKRLHQPS